MVDIPTEKNWTTNEFVQPKKCINTVEDLEKWKKSESFVRYMTFITDCQKAVESKPISATPKSSKFDHIVVFLEDLDTLIDEVPPLKQPMRFGNKAFKTWHEQMEKVISRE